jgi:hypothetical protein
VRIEAHGIAADLPRGWSGRIFRFPGGGPTLHAATFALASEDSSFGDASTALISAGGAFVALTEYLPGSGLRPGVGLFAPRRIPAPLDPTSFSTRKLAHARPGQTATQHFFTLGGRPFCLYVVIGLAGTRRPSHLAAVDAVLASIRVAPPP